MDAGLPGLQVIPGAILRATRPGEKGDFAQPCGVFDTDRRPVGLARTTSRVGPVALACPCPDPETLALRKGRWLFGGIGFHHFGHTLIFSTARLWALPGAGPLDGILYFDRSARPATRDGTTANLAAILALLGVDLPVVTVGRDERVETLVVPGEGISTSASLFAGTAPYRDAIRARLDRVPGESPHPRVYVSRRGLGLIRTGLLFEDRLETLLAAEGYHIFHPERHPLAAQVATYRNARHIIGPDGSAMHLVAMSARPSATVTVIGRRPFYPGAIAAQTRFLSGAAAAAIPAGPEVYVRMTGLWARHPWFFSHCLPDFPGLAQDLVTAGALDRLPRDWTRPGAEDLDRRLDLIARRTGAWLARLPDWDGEALAAPAATALPLAPRPPSA